MLAICYFNLIIIRAEAIESKRINLTMTDANSQFMRAAIALSRQAIQSNQGGPFGSVIVRNGEIIASGQNQVTSSNDPTAHAEVVAIRAACSSLQSWQLNGCELYTSCEPCPMCLGAIYWARPDRVYFANTRFDAAAIDFDDEFIYAEIKQSLSDRAIPMVQLLRSEALIVFDEWAAKSDKIEY